MLSVFEAFLGLWAAFVVCPFFALPIWYGIGGVKGIQYWFVTWIVFWCCMGIWAFCDKVGRKENSDA